MGKRIQGYDSYYAHKEGYIISTKGRFNRRLKQHVNLRNGYCYVVLSKNDLQQNVRVHRIIAEAFIENPENKCDVNHIDGNKTNNHVDNLEWNTRRENVLHALKLGLSKPPPLRPKSPVAQYTLDGRYVREYASQLQAEKISGVRNAAISEVCRGKRKTAGGFIWIRI